MNTAGANEYGFIDERLYPLAFDLFACVHAILASPIAGVPYSVAREAMRFSADEEAELARAIEKLVIEHAAVFAEYKEIVELGVAFMAIQAARLDQALCLTAGDQPLTRKQSVVGVLMVLAPLVFALAIYLLNLLVTKLRG
jgi:hypothetical protein